MASTREVLETTIQLEEQSMAIYARFSQRFADNPSLHEFWFSMARDEARHVGALKLVLIVLGLEDRLDRPSPVEIQKATIGRLRECVERSSLRSEPPISIEEALQVALDVEETELEDLVGDLLKRIQEKDEYERYLRLLVHDLGELSYMIEQYSQDPALLQRCDALVNRHAETLHRAAGR